MRPTTRLLPVLSLGLAACSASGGAETTAVVRDSAGITIVENRSAAWGDTPRWLVSQEPLVDIGILDGPAEYQLFRAVDAVRLPDGRIVIANSGTGELRYFNADGDHLLSVGRKGAGPGEFESIGWIETIGSDSIIAYDSQLGRVSTFDSAGKFVESRTIQSIAGTRPFSAIARFANGSFLLRGTASIDPQSLRTGLHRLPFTLFRSNEDGGADSLDTFPDAGTMIFIDANSISVMAGEIMHRPALAAGEARFIVGTQDEYEVEVRAADGEVERRIRWSGPDLTMTSDIIERYRERRLAAVSSEEERRALEQRLASVQYPEKVPAYGTILFDVLGNLWVERFRGRGEEENRWDVFDGEGHLLGTVELPVGLQVDRIGEDFVLGRWTDDLDVEHVRLYQLTRQ
jgi:hypothetical protein